MKKIIFFILISVIILIAIFGINYLNYVSNKKQILNQNKEYIQYEGSVIKINQVTTVMNKAIDNNKKNDIETDENGKFIENDTNSIKVYLEIESRDSVIPMEDLLLSEVSTTAKVEKLFSDMFFEYKEIKYHQKTGQVSEIIFRAIEEE